MLPLTRMIKFADSHELVIGVEAELIKEAQAVASVVQGGGCFVVTRLVGTLTGLRRPRSIWLRC
jgi:hypothetical protein